MNKNQTSAALTILLGILIALPGLGMGQLVRSGSWPVPARAGVFGFERLLRHGPH